MVFQITSYDTIRELLPLVLFFLISLLPIVSLILYALASLELITADIENPFGTNANDLPEHSQPRSRNPYLFNLLPVCYFLG